MDDYSLGDDVEQVPFILSLVSFQVFSFVGAHFYFLTIVMLM